MVILSAHEVDDALDGPAGRRLQDIDGSTRIKPSQRVEPDLDQLAPGPILAAVLSTIDVSRCSGHDRVIVLRAHQRLASHYQARVYEDMASVSDHFEAADDEDIELATEGTVAEVRAALHLTRRAADAEVNLALSLKRRLPEVWRALAAGDLDARRARTIVNGTAHLSQASARLVTSEIMPKAPTMTTGQLVASLRRLCIEVDPAEAEDRYRHAVADRRVVLEATDSGAARLCGLDLPADRAAAAAGRIDRLARHLKTSEEARTMDQLRADVMVDLLTGAGDVTGPAGTGSGEATGASRARRDGVRIRVDLETLAGLADTPGELEGYGPVIAEVARQVAGAQIHQRWSFEVTDDDSGMVISTGTIRRRPTAAQQRQVAAESSTCVFPGCRMPAVDCDLDHRHDWSMGGSTTVENLAPLCRHDHRIKHRLGWKYGRSSAGHEWTTKLGHTYTTTIPP